MVMRQIRPRHPYNTRSNKVKKVRTPGGKLVFHNIKKKISLPSCSICKEKLQGIRRATNAGYKLLKRKHRTVSRIFGGNTCAN
ncbi:60S ribosomal protein, partial [Pseudoloma neurophilia]